MAAKTDNSKLSSSQLHAARVLELGLPPADDLAHRRPRYRRRPDDLLDRPALLEIRATDLADQVHADHPHTPFQAASGQKEGTLTQRQRGSGLDAKTALRGSLLRAILQYLVSEWHLTLH